MFLLCWVTADPADGKLQQIPRSRAAGYEQALQDYPPQPQPEAEAGWAYESEAEEQSEYSESDGGLTDGAADDDEEDDEFWAEEMMFENAYAD